LNTPVCVVTMTDTETDSVMPDNLPVEDMENIAATVLKYVLRRGADLQKVLALVGSLEVVSTGVVPKPVILRGNRG
jgi:hypothetical protein